MKINLSMQFNLSQIWELPKPCSVQSDCDELGLTCELPNDNQCLASECQLQKYCISTRSISSATTLDSGTVHLLLLQSETLVNHSWFTLKIYNKILLQTLEISPKKCFAIKSVHNPLNMGHNRLQFTKGFN